VFRWREIRPSGPRQGEPQPARRLPRPVPGSVSRAVRGRRSCGAALGMELATQRAETADHCATNMARPRGNSTYPRWAGRRGAELGSDPDLRR
jgi:hypothetical protein